MDFAFDDTTRALQERVLAFMDECVYPAGAALPRRGDDGR